VRNDFSNFKSALEPERKPEEEPTGELIQIGKTDAILRVVDSVAESFAMAGLTESPIETLFGARFAFHMRRFGLQAGFSFEVGDHEADIILQPQFKLGRFRYDFAILVHGHALVLIECDGKDYHSSPDQVANDAKKDQAAEDYGVALVRFSGSDLHRKTDWCVGEALAVLAGRMRA
jgi:very-short-patch-repair endonuclease